jgi:hypothetical protein
MIDSGASTRFLIARDLVQSNGIPLSISIPVTNILEITYNFYVDSTQGFLNNWLVLIGGNMVSNTALPIITLSGFTTTIDVGSTPHGIAFYYNLLMSEGTYPYGICVGSSDTPVSSSDYRLGQIIEHGTGSNQLIYGGSIYLPHTTFPETFVSQSFVSKVIRRFYNHSSSSIDVKEIGIILPLYNTFGQPPSYNRTCTLVVRKTPGTLSVAPNQILHVAFIFTVSSSIPPTLLA